MLGSLVPNPLAIILPSSPETSATDKDWHMSDNPFDYNAAPAVDLVATPGFDTTYATIDPDPRSMDSDSPSAATVATVATDPPDRPVEGSLHDIVTWLEARLDWLEAQVE